MIKYENFIELQEQDAIEQVVTSSMFPWYYNPSTVNPYDQYDIDSLYVLREDGYNPHQFSHQVISSSKCISGQIYPLIEPILQQIAKEVEADIEIIRAKFNLLTKDPCEEYHCPHTDTNKVGDNIKTLLYYVCDSDGDTYIFKERAPLTNRSVTIDTRVTPKKGTAILFDSEVLHSSSSPNISSYRIVLNVVFKVIK